MKKKNIFKAVLVTAILGSVSLSHATTIDSGAFGNATTTQVNPVQKNANECMSFEATFNKPLENSPSAMLDIEHHFMNMLNTFLEVTKISDRKYRLALTAKTGEGCPEVQSDSRLTISTFSGSEKEDDRQTKPESVTFTAQGSKKNPRLKKE